MKFPSIFVGAPISVLMEQAEQSKFLPTIFGAPFNVLSELQKLQKKLPVTWVGAFFNDFI